MARDLPPRGARRVLLGPLWQWAIVLAVIAPLGLAVAAWGGAFTDAAADLARDALRVWALLLLAATAAWLAVVMPAVALSTITARRRGTQGLVGQGAALFWAGMALVLVGLFAAAAVWLALGGWPR